MKPVRVFGWLATHLGARASKFSPCYHGRVRSARRLKQVSWFLCRMGKAILSSEPNVPKSSCFLALRGGRLWPGQGPSAHRRPHMWEMNQRRNYLCRFFLFFSIKLPSLNCMLFFRSKKKKGIVCSFLETLPRQTRAF